MKKIIGIISFLVLLGSISAQTKEAEEALLKKSEEKATGWKTGGLIAVNFSQAAFSAYWSTGTKNSMTLNSLLNVYANYIQERMFWENNLVLNYGFIKQGSGDVVKSDDKIDLTSKYGYQASSYWYYAVLFNFKSQMTPTKDELTDKTISEFLSPATSLFAIGMDYKPVPQFSMFISPATARSDIMTNKNLRPAGTDEIETALGGYLRAVYKDEIFTNVSLESKLELISNYDHEPQNVDVFMDNLLTMKVNEFLSANFNYAIAHDNDYNTKTQFKEVLGIGLSYKF